ncbi:MAG: TraB/GumN family protein [Parafilimonas sp.]
MLRKIAPLFVLFFIVNNAFTQTLKPSKYPSLFWEITGNGLTKPSYLFGTMHVSNKLAFHLSDSFYNAIQHTDMVALELNPENWQEDMVKMDAAQQELSNFYKDNTTQYITESSFRIDDYYDRLKAALTADPQQVNSLLYRTFSVQQDYEEDTYLDLYIYQTGRKFGKLAGGVEDYYQTQKILFEAYAAMAKEKIKRTTDAGSESTADINKKIQEAYRRGDLDMLDSLERTSFNSPAYIDKFLYDRNKIQANSIDTLIKQHSIFVGVGAAHLPGAKGVIELLRKKGYTLRPIFMQDRDASAKESAEKLKVPVNFYNVETDDGFVHVKMPGPLYKMPASNYNNANDNWQYADMDNGAYYMLTRVKTHAGLLNQSIAEVLQKTDSLLYENIPGKIISKKPIEKNGYKGFDITNKTRRGDVQRYNIFITPFEILIFKMSGTGDYVNGDEAATFFNSISFNVQPLTEKIYTSSKAGFHVHFPQFPQVNKNSYANDVIDEWEFESDDSTNGNAYAVYKKSVINLNYMEEDTFDISLIERSLQSSDIIDKEIIRSFFKVDGYNALKMQFALKNGNFINAEAILKGPHYFLLMQTSRKKNNADTSFFNSFGFNNVPYAAATIYTDTLLNFQVKTPVKPTLDSSLTHIMYEMLHDENFVAQMQKQSYWPKNEYAMFKSDSTGEAVLVSMYDYPKYYYAKDSAAFWKKQLDFDNNEAYVYSKTAYTPCDSCEGYKIYWRDTNTVRQIINYKILKQNRLYNLYTITDTVSNQSSFIKDFFKTFTPLYKNERSVYSNKINTFFSDIYSPDSLTKARARNAIPNIYYGPENIEKILSFINNLKYGEQDYFDMKQKFISELGYIDDSCCTDKVVHALEGIYKQTADTAYFQNEIFWALQNIKTRTSYAVLKDLLLQDPPLFNDNDDYSDFFEKFQDSLQLTRALFPEILQLTSIEDYKEPVIDLLATMLDSGLISSKDYASYFSKIYFDARIEMKKQQNAEEKLLEQQSQKNFNEDQLNNDVYSPNNSAASDIDKYATLLLPFYDSNPALPKFFDRLLQSKDTGLQLRTAVLLIKNNKAVADSVLNNIASKDNYRSQLLQKLEEINHAGFFPLKYKKQELISRSVLLNNSEQTAFAQIETEGKISVNFKDEKGYVYLFKYKIKNDDDWQIGISGLQPENLKEVNTNNILTSMTNKKLTNDKPALQQFNDELQRMILKLHKSSAHFFSDDESSYTGYDDGN